MDDSSKLEKVNSKLDELKDDFSELKTEIKLLIQKLEIHIKEDKELVEKFEPIHNEYIYSKEARKHLADNMKKLGLFSVIIGVIYKVLRMTSIL